MVIKGIGTMTARKGISSMGLEKETPPKGNGDTAFASGVDDTSSSPSHSPTEAAVPARPRKLVVLHWLTVFCVIAAVTFILTRDQVDGKAVRQWLLEGHRHFGLFVLMLFLARVAIRFRLGKLPQADRLPRVARLLAGLTHVALYALLLTLPLLGWALSSAEGKPVHLFGLTLPALVSADEDLADTLQAWHLNAAWVLLGLVSLHVAAALWHHFVLRDEVLRRMLPGRRR
jgi:cytochrome b561